MASRILVVDDDAAARASLRELLEGEGHEVREARNGAEALRLYQEDPPDVLITDIMMPEKDGLAVIVELRRDYPAAKIIAISAVPTGVPSPYLEIARVLGAQHALAKPIERERLLQAVTELTRRR